MNYFICKPNTKNRPSGWSWLHQMTYQRLLSSLLSCFSYIPYRPLFSVPSGPSAPENRLFEQSFIYSKAEPALGSSLYGSCTVITMINGTVGWHTHDGPRHTHTHTHSLMGNMCSGVTATPHLRVCNIFGVFSPTHTNCSCILFKHTCSGTSDLGRLIPPQWGNSTGVGLHQWLGYVEVRAVPKLRSTVTTHVQTLTHLRSDHWRTYSKSQCPENKASIQKWAQTLNTLITCSKQKH